MPRKQRLVIAFLAALLTSLVLAAPPATAAPVSLSLSGPSQAAVGDEATLDATVAGYPAQGSWVGLELKVLGLFWYNVDAAQVGADQQAHFTVKPTLPGWYQYRSVLYTPYGNITSAEFGLLVGEAAPPLPEGAPASDACGPTRVKANGQVWECTYSDEFDGTELDREFWYPHVTATSGLTNGTSSMYTCYGDREDVIAVRDGNLELSMVRLPEVVDCGKGKASQYVAGQVSHFGTHSQTYGKYEIRAKLPDVRVAGVQETFWLWPVKDTYGPWPLSGEIDFAEFYSNHPDHVIPKMHYWAGPTNLARSENINTAMCAINPGEFNTYGLEWTPRKLRIFVNDVLCVENNYSSPIGVLNPAAPFDQPFFLALTQLMGTTGNVFDPAVMPERVTTQIDHVRIWQ